MKCKRCGKENWEMREYYEDGKDGIRVPKKYWQCVNCGNLIEEQKTNKGFGCGLASMILGISGIIFSFGCAINSAFFLLVLLFFIVGVVFSVVSIATKEEKTGFSISGLVCLSASIFIGIIALTLIPEYNAESVKENEGADKIGQKESDEKEETLFGYMTDEEISDLYNNLNVESYVDRKINITLEVGREAGEDEESIYFIGCTGRTDDTLFGSTCVRYKDLDFRYDVGDIVSIDGVFSGISSTDNENYLLVEASSIETIEKTYRNRKEILFGEIPWGTSYTDAENMKQELEMYPISGDAFKTMSVDAVLLGDYEGVDFEYGDINIIGNALNGEIEVAGYKTSEVNLFFSYIPVDGVLTRKEPDSSFYGAQYIFEPMNLEEMSNDLINKLSSIYGKPDKTTEDADMWSNEYTYTFWYGANDTELVLKTVDSKDDSTGFYEDEIVISYAWRKGDELLQSASDALKNSAIEKESNAYGNDSTDGL